MLASTNFKTNLLESTSLLNVENVIKVMEPPNHPISSSLYSIPFIFILVNKGIPVSFLIYVLPYAINFIFSYLNCPNFKNNISTTYTSSNQTHDTKRKCKGDFQTKIESKLNHFN